MTRQKKAAVGVSRRGGESNRLRRVHSAAESAQSQCVRLLQHLARNGHIDTHEARDMDIMHPAGRILQLRKIGLAIRTDIDPLSRVGTYVLLGVAPR